MGKPNKFIEKKARNVDRLIQKKAERDKLTAEASKVLAELSMLRVAEMSAVAQVLRKEQTELSKRLQGMHRAAKKDRDKQRARSLRKILKKDQAPLADLNDRLGRLELRIFQAKKFSGCYAEWLDEPLDDFLSLEYRNLLIRYRNLASKRALVLREIDELIMGIRKQNRREKRIKEKQDENRVFQVHPELEAILAKHDIDRPKCKVREKKNQIDIYYSNFGSSVGFKHGHMVIDTTCDEIAYYRKYGRTTWSTEPC